eukprot:3848406-Alexandrium_andersonii.AAC.1
MLQPPVLPPASPAPCRPAASRCPARPSRRRCAPRAPASADQPAFPAWPGLAEPVASVAPEGTVLAVPAAAPSSAV